MRELSSLRIRMGHALLALLLAVGELVIASRPVDSYGADFEGPNKEYGGISRTDALFINDLHPDLPLSHFAAGRLGVIRASWAKSYLIVSYRYLSGIPLDKNEQESILALWHKRINDIARRSIVINGSCDDELVSYFKLRNKVLGKSGKRDDFRYDFDYDEQVIDDAFRFAKENLEIMIKRFGLKSEEVRKWLFAQDMVFGCNPTRMSKMPSVAPVKADALSRIQHEYQAAAASFYARDFNKAKLQFDSIAKINDPYWNDLAWYMSARCAVSTALVKSNASSLESTQRFIAAILAKNKTSKYAEDLVDLQTLLRYRSQAAAKSLKQLCKAVMQPHSKRFGNNTGDITDLMDNSEEPAIASSESGPNDQIDKGWLLLDKNDLTDWLSTIQSPCASVYGYLEEAAHQELEKRERTFAAHAMERWRKTHALPWFVAAISSNNLSDKNNKDLLSAAEKLGADSLAFMTARFYLIDRIIKEGRRTEARKSLLSMLARKDLALSERNIFMCQLQMVSRTPIELFKNMVQSPSSYSYGNIHAGDDTPFPKIWRQVEKQKSYYQCTPTICHAHLDDLNKNLPLSYWVKLAKDKTIPARVHQELVRCAWLRSVILNRESGLEDALVQAYPSLRKLVDTYKNAQSGAEKRFALACLILMNRGMDPELEPINHHGGIDEHDYFNGNYWSSETNEQVEKLEKDKGGDGVDRILASYEEPVLRRLLSTAEQRQVDAEHKVIDANDPPHLLCQTVMDWAWSHPEDPRVPEMLYRIVKLPLWAKHTDYGSKYSHRAFNVLHKQYPKSSWTNRLQWWY